MCCAIPLYRTHVFLKAELQITRLQLGSSFDSVLFSRVVRCYGYFGDSVCTGGLVFSSRLRAPCSM